MKNLKSSLLLLVALIAALPAFAQDLYWVFLSDKQGSTFDPYTYFDAKAIERYRLNHADLYHISNYPLSSSYVSQVSALSSEQLGQSRWLNAMAVTATPDQISAIRLLPFVRDVRLIASDMQLAQHTVLPAPEPLAQASAPIQGLVMANQLLRMRGDLFRTNNIDGHGVRIAVFDNGFPSVDNHKVFKHLRDNNQIISTWNFPEKKADVYGPGGHGTMVLSCIAGIYDSLQLGLATGAEFLLARTEIEAEPFKEEVWWMMAVEWADKNGADIINSSLGYGKDRHYTYEMDGRSYVAKAANMAARKGILVCNSAGNEGDDNSWKTIITPADADSVLCVGGITPSLTSYNHISFSSFGPSADGRLKPNVCNFGMATVAKPRTTDQSEEVFGTSFSSPLTAGFCACAKQARPDLSAMQLKEAVEHSADLYPYFDYAFGYGVPQASYFVGPKSQPVAPTFSFVDHGSYIAITPNGSYTPSLPSSAFIPSSSADTIHAPKYNIFFKVSDKKGAILHYTNLVFDKFGPDESIAIRKGALHNKVLTASLGGYTDSYSLSDVDAKQILINGTICDYEYAVIDTAGFYVWNYTTGIDRTPDDLRINEFSDKWKIDFSLGCGLGIATSSDQLSKVPIQAIIDLRLSRQLRRWYSLGFGLGFDVTGVTFANGSSSPVDAYLGIPTTGLGYRQLRSRNSYAEFFQRIRIIPGGLTHNGKLWWDLGIFAQASFVDYEADYTVSNANYESLSSTYSDIAAFNQIFGYGISTRLMYDVFGIYARYRLSGQPGAQAAGIEMPRLNIGLILDI